MNLPEEEIMRWIDETKKFGEPKHKMARRFVTVTADPHGLNIIRDDEGEIYSIDLEMTHSNYAAQDLAYHIQFCYNNSDQKRRFMKSYLEYYNEDTSPENIDDLLLDLERISPMAWICGGYCPIIPDWPCDFSLTKNPRCNYAYLRGVRDLVDDAYDDKELREDLL